MWESWWGSLQQVQSHYVEEILKLRKKYVGEKFPAVNSQLPAMEHIARFQ